MTGHGHAIRGGRGKREAAVDVAVAARRRWLIRMVHAAHESLRYRAATGIDHHASHCAEVGDPVIVTS